MSRGARAALVGVLALLATLVGANPSAFAERVTQEGLGAVPLAGEGREQAPPQQRALRAAIGDAVARATEDLVAAEDPFLDPAAAIEALGEDRVRYAARYRVVEDRGVVEAEVSPEAGAGAQYVLLIEAEIELDRIRKRLDEAGLLVFRNDDRPRARMRLVLEGDFSYAGYRRIVEVLRETGNATEPVGFRRGEAALDVETAAGRAELTALLRQQLGPAYALEPSKGDGASLRLRVQELSEPSAAASSVAAPDALRLP